MADGLRLIKKIYIIFSCIIIALIITGSYLYYNLYVKSLAAGKSEYLAAMAKIKVNELNLWIKERFSEAEFFPGNEPFISAILNFLSDTESKKQSQFFRRALKPTVENHNYENIIIASIKGDVLFSYAPGDEILEESTKQSLRQAADSKKIIIKDFELSGRHSHMHFEIISPIYNDDKVVALMIFRINPETFLYTALQTWPIKSNSAESILIKKENNGIRYLNELRHKKNTAIEIFEPLTSKESVTIKALSGKTFIRGYDYRNVEVVAAVNKVHGTDWFMISKVDSDELYGIVSTITVSLNVFTISTICLVIISALFFYERRKNIHLQLLSKDRFIAEKKQEFDTALYSITDGVITVDNDSRIKLMNKSAEDLCGWNEEEAKDKLVSDVCILLNETSGGAVDVISESDALSLSDRLIVFSKYGKRIPVSRSIVPIITTEGEIAGKVISLKNRSAEREAELRLEESETRYRSIFQNNHSVMIIVEPETATIADANPAACEFYGYTHEEMTGMDITKIQQTDKELLLEQMQLAAKQGRTRFIFKHRLASGEIKNVESYNGPISIQGKTYLFTILFDVTERKIAEQALRLSEDKFSKAFFTSPDAIAINRVSDGLYLEINNGFTELTGYTKEEVVGKTSKEINIWVDFEDRNRLIKLLLNEDKADNMEALFRTKNGKILIGLMSARIIIINGEECMINITRDITDRKIAEEKIKKLSMGIEQSPIMVVITDVNGNIEYTNPIFSQITGYSFEEVNGKNPRLLKSGNTPKEVYVNLWSTILSKKDWHGELMNKKKNGEIYWELVSISPILNEHNDIINFIALKEDITEWKRVNNELMEAKEKAEEMNRLKSFFFANMSHELRTPFVGIIGFSELLTERLTDPLEKEMAQSILSSSQRLINTLNQIMDLTKLEFQKMDVELTEVDLRDTLESIILLYLHSAQKQNTELITEFEMHPACWISDGRLIREILNNLINNAVKFTVNGIVKINISMINTNGMQMLQIKIADTGVGIPKEKQDIIWQEFRQVSEGFGRSFEGTGLGLSLTRKYTELLGGTIELKSEPGKGSEFTVKLPPGLTTSQAMKNHFSNN